MKGPKVRGKPGALLISWNLIGNGHGNRKGGEIVYYLVKRRELGRSKAFEVVRRLNPSVPAGAKVEGGEVTVADFGLKQGETYEYKVIAVDARGRKKAESEVVRVKWIEPPAAPSRVRAEPGDARVRISWEPPLDGDIEKISGYVVCRVDCLGESDEPEFARHVKGTSFLDLDVENNKEYCYQVNAEIRAGDALLEGEPSVQVSAVPRDLVAPPPPERVQAVRTLQGVSVRWEAVNANDLAGYKVYRMNLDTGETICLTDSPISSTSYVDSEPVGLPGKWVYFVTSVDDAPSANESPPSQASEPVEIDRNQTGRGHGKDSDNIERCCRPHGAGDTLFGGR